MTQEEKAKRYDEAIEKLRSLHDDYDTVSTLIDIKEELENIFPELKESDDERIRKAIIDFFSEPGRKTYILNGFTVDDIIAWLEKQAEHANFRNKIQIGDKVTRNRDGVLVNLSQLNRVAKKDEKQGEQKSAWSEEDEERVEEMIEYLEELYDRNRFSLDELNDKKHWLKSLRPQSQWKPSDEQIHWLKWVVNRMPDTEKANEAEAVLEELLEQLKKLREE